jgi:hypothetical protein
MEPRDLRRGRVGTGAAAAALTRLLEIIQRFMWGGSGTDLLEAAESAGAWRHILVLLGAGLVTGAGQIVLRHLSSGNGIDTTAAIWFHAGADAGIAYAGQRCAFRGHRRHGRVPWPGGRTETSRRGVRQLLLRPD